MAMMNQARPMASNDVMPPQAMAGQYQAMSTQQATPGGLLGNINANRHSPSTTTSGGVDYRSGSYRSPGTGGAAAGAQPANATQWNSNYGAIDTGADNFRQFADTAYNQGLSRLQPQMDQSNRALQSQLVARGLEPGTAAFQSAMDQQGRTNNDMYNSLNASAEQIGMAAQNQAFNQGMQNNQFGLAQNNQNYNQQFGYDQLAAQRAIAQNNANSSIRTAQIGQDGQNYRAGLNHELGINQLNSNNRQFDINNITQTQGMDQNFMLGLLGAQNSAQQTGINQFLAQQGANQNWFGQGSGMLGMAPGAQFSPTSGLAQGSMTAGNNMAGAAANQNQGLGQLLGAGLSMIPGMPSDVRLKKDIEYVETVEGVDVFEWIYKDAKHGEGKHRGVIAQLVEKTHPWAVKMVDGFKHVVYEFLPVDMEVVQ